MADGDAINSDMARILLRKIKKQDTSGSTKSEEKNDMKMIIDKLNKLQNSLDKDSKEAEAQRKTLIEELLEQFDKKSLSIKEQKEMLAEVDENIRENYNLLKSFNVANINKFFTAISNPKLLGEAINKGLSSSVIGKALEIIPQMFSKIGGVFNRIVGVLDNVRGFFANPAEHLKDFGTSIVTKASAFIQDQFKKFTATLWRVAVKPILTGLGKLGAQMFTIGLDITIMLTRMAVGFVVWMVSTIIPILGTILGFIMFTVVPMLFSVVAAIATAVGTILAAIAPILLIAAAILIIGILLGYLLYKAYGKISDFVSYIFSAEFLDDVASALTWVWDNVVKPVWEGFVWAWENVAVPVFKWLGDAFMWSWENVILPVAKWLGEAFMWSWENVILPAVKWLGEAFMWYWENVTKPLFKWISEGLMWSWENVAKPVFVWLGDVFMAAWPLMVEGFDYMKELLSKIFSAVNLVGEGLGSVASGIGEGVAGAWEWTTSFFAKGGIVTRPTNAVIGEGGVNEAVIPLDKKGMQFIRDSFQVDDVAVQQIVKNSDLYKNQNKMMDLIEIMSKDIKQIKFSVADLKKDNQIEKPKEVYVALIRPEQLDQIEQDPKKLFDITELEKTIGDSNVSLMKKMQEIIEFMKAMPKGDSESLLNPGTATNDEFQNLVKALSTGILGVR